MRQFNLEEYLKNPSQKVITRDGRAVRIVCTNFKGTQPIIALIEKGEKEDIHLFYKDGRWSNTNENCLDLFVAPTKREGWVNIYKRMTKCSYVEESIYYSKEIAIKNKFGDSYITTTKIEWEE